jgi:bifunctional non-homologous end joining protein LigD
VAGRGRVDAELSLYYVSVAELMLPHIVDRPLSLVRCPGGFTGECFYQKHIENFPKAVATVDIDEPEEGRAVPYARVTGIDSVVGLAQMGVLEIHPWGSRADAPDKPDRLVFDLDPDTELPFSQIAATALLLRSELERLGLESWLKGTGGKGLHVVVPVARRHSWDEVRTFSRAFVDSIVAMAPDMFTANMSKAKRGGRIFIDYLRNARGATAVGAYSTRARPGATVSVPLLWSEIENTEERPEFTVRTLSERISAPLFRDPWRDLAGSRQSITNAARSRLGI